MASLIMHFLTTKFTKQTEGLPWEVQTDQTISSSYSSSKTACVAENCYGNLGAHKENQVLVEHLL